MKIYDITPPITSSLAVFPGDVPYRRAVSMDFSMGHHLALSSYQSTFHLGAHADSSSHYHAKGQGVEERDLVSYLGKCQVIETSPGLRRPLLPQDLHQAIQAPRVLFKTNTFSDPNLWRDDFASLSPELLRLCAEKKVCLVGIDTPSVDPSDSKTLDAHQVLFQANMAVLEGLLLKDVAAGFYTLIALPLPFVGADASPVRAVLLEPDVEISGIY